jgi:hypothetical protein
MDVMDLDPRLSVLHYKTRDGTSLLKPATQRLHAGCKLNRVTNEITSWKWNFVGDELVAYCNDQQITHCEVLCAKASEGLGGGAIVLAIYVPCGTAGQPMIVDLAGSLTDKRITRLNLACRIRMAFGARGVHI